MQGNAPGPLFSHPDGRPFTYQKVMTIFDTVLSLCGIDTKRYTGHSFRIGAATEAARAGYSDAQIHLMGRWKSNAFRKYILAF